MQEVPVSNAFDVDADVRLEYALAHAEYGQRAASLAVAELLVGIDGTLDEARRHPELFASEAFRGDDLVAFAERSAVADLAVRLRMSESTVRLHAERARVLIASLPSIWSALCEGEVPARNAETAQTSRRRCPQGRAGRRSMTRCCGRRESAIRRDSATVLAACATNWSRPRPSSGTRPSTRCVEWRSRRCRTAWSGCRRTSMRPTAR